MGGCGVDEVQDEGWVEEDERDVGCGEEIFEDCEEISCGF